MNTYYGLAIFVGCCMIARLILAFWKKDQFTARAQKFNLDSNSGPQPAGSTARLIPPTPVLHANGMKWPE